MSIRSIIFHNLIENMKHYFLYVFALVFSASLYFSFVTLQYDPAVDRLKGGIKGAAAIGASSILLVAIVGIFLLYANNLFIRRRGKEIALFQLVGMTKNRIFRILTVENFLLYFVSLLIGVGIGLFSSRLLMNILLNLTGVQASASLDFSIQALIQTLLVFMAIYVLIMLSNYLFIKQQTILGLFETMASTEDKGRKLTFLEVFSGIAGLGLIIYGYYSSSQLFNVSNLGSVNELMVTMVLILGSVIAGTYLFYKGSVRCIFHLARKRKNGYLTVKEVLSLSSIMFRIQSNALLLTIITTVSALAIGLLSLSYISYYSAGKMAEATVPDDFAFIYEEDANAFSDKLAASGISFEQNSIGVLQINARLLGSVDKSGDEPKETPLGVISDSSVEGMDLSEHETFLSGYSDALKILFPGYFEGRMELTGIKETIPLDIKGIQKKSLVSLYFSNGNFPVAIVDEAVFQRLKEDANPELQLGSSTYIGIGITDKEKIEEANELFMALELSKNRYNGSQLDSERTSLQNFGLLLFVVGFLGLAFLMTSGCILYFKQMEESQGEKPSFTILRKLGFSRGDMLSGIILKQLFGFGIPLIVGLGHSYYAVRSGWFFFGTELWTPMLIVVAVYGGLYSIFGVLSVFYGKKVIKESL
ncbi:FtsX-like permease family protein [Paenibacillus sp. CAU 1782]